MNDKSSSLGKKDKALKRNIFMLQNDFLLITNLIAP